MKDASLKISKTLEMLLYKRRTNATISRAIRNNSARALRTFRKKNKQRSSAVKERNTVTAAVDTAAFARIKRPGKTKTPGEKERERDRNKERGKDIYIPVLYIVTYVRITQLYGQ